MTNPRSEFTANAHAYLDRITSSFNEANINVLALLAHALRDAWVSGSSVFLCGNGGSAANAIHIANDLLYGVGAHASEPDIPGLRVEALSANPAVITCLANDLAYDEIFSSQLLAKARSGDILLVLSGSGNSSNIIKALTTATALGMRTFAILGYDGGACKLKADYSIHFPVDDMQASEDLQMIASHICMQWLGDNKQH